MVVDKSTDSSTEQRNDTAIADMRKTKRRNINIIDDWTIYNLTIKISN